MEDFSELVDGGLGDFLDLDIRRFALVIIVRGDWDMLVQVSYIEASKKQVLPRLALCMVRAIVQAGGGSDEEVRYPTTKESM